MNQAENVVAILEDAAQREQAVAQHASPSETAAILNMIERVASNKDVDFERFERLIAMRERMEEKEAKKAFTAAFAIMQPKLPVIDQNGTIIIHNKDDANKPVDQRRVIQSTPFAKWEDINEAITPILGEHGFTLSFTSEREGDRVIVNAFLEHVGGHAKTTSMPLALDTTGSKNNVQAVGSSLSYGQRYSARLLLNFTSRAKVDRDDDGRAAGDPAGPEVISEDQTIQLRELIEWSGANVPLLKKHFSIDSLDALPAARFGEAERLLKAKGGRK